MTQKVDFTALLSQMTLEEKIGQLTQCNGFDFLETDAVLTGPEGGNVASELILRTAGSALNFSSAKEAYQLQKTHLELDRNHIPMLLMMDVIHGYRTIYPIPLALGASFDPELVYECSRMAAREASAGGIHGTFTPMVDFVRDARWGRVMETSGEDAYLNGVMGMTQVKAFQGNDLKEKDCLAACVKHFAGYGGAEAGRDYNTVEISERVLREYYLPAYKACVDAGVKMLMPSFNSLNGVPSTANPWLMQKILRDEWHFDGVVISDYNAVAELVTHGVAENLREAARKAFENGCHIDMASFTYATQLKELFEQGILKTEDLDDAVLKILKLKEELGLFEDPYRGIEDKSEAELCLTDENRALARKAAEECAVLLKNDGILPLSPSARSIALIGPYADSNQIKGFWSCNGRDEDCVSVKEGIRNLLPDAKITCAKGCSAYGEEEDEESIKAAVQTAKTAETVILCLGEPQDYSGEGKCRVDLTLPGRQMELARAILADHPNAPVVLFGGRPLVLTELEKTAQAMLMMWYPGTEGGNAAARLLFGIANPCGKISMSFPKAVGQCPIYYNHPNTGRPKQSPEDEYQPFVSNYLDCGNLPLYSFGHGLSYTNFSYENLTLDKNEMEPKDLLHVSVTVKNTGKMAGKETVQLYLRDLAASVVRPVQQLIGFDKIELQPGQEKTVTFTVDEEKLRFWNAQNEWISEPGEFTVSTGYADHLLLTKSFYLKDKK